MTDVAMIVGDYGSLWWALPIVAYTKEQVYLFVDRKTPAADRDRFLTRLRAEHVEAFVSSRSA